MCRFLPFFKCVKVFFLLKRFEICRKLGQGTYGKVQLGVNKETGQQVRGRPRFKSLIMKFLFISILHGDYVLFLLYCWSLVVEVT